MPSLLSLLVWFAAWARVTSRLLKLQPHDVRRSQHESSGSKVRVEFFVMSKCPDAAACERAFGPVLKELAPAVNVSLEYIGDANQGSAECMHGPSECAGNVQQLCAQAEAGNISQLMDFLTCQNQNRKRIPDNGEECFARAGYDTSRMKACSSSSKGTEMLLKSFGVSERRGILLSCTLSVNGKEFCAHDGSWVGCSACDAYAEKGSCLRDTICKLSPGVC
mmetsp:Transcript_134555/g.418158  ORF Transcript_134555/g.418158 Transcript_134555/m.418158 type:complete len:221 (-) Transcript_134555:269-931(-)